jgi:hypothetical protein
MVGLNRPSNSCAIANIGSVNTGEALAFGKANSGEGACDVADGNHGSGVSVSNTASTSALVSAEALICRNIIVRVVEDSVITSVCGARAVHAGFVVGFVHCGIAARAE